MKNLPEVRERLSSWLAAFNERDIDAMMSLYDPDSAYAGGRTPLMRGVDEIRACYERAFPQITGTLLFEEEAAFQQDGMALIYGKFYFKPASDVAEPGMTGRVGLVYRKAEGGN